MTPPDVLAEEAAHNRSMRAEDLPRLAPVSLQALPTLGLIATLRMVADDSTSSAAQMLAVLHTDPVVREVLTPKEMRALASVLVADSVRQVAVERLLRAFSRHITRRDALELAP